MDVRLIERGKKLYVEYYQDGKRKLKSTKLNSTKQNIKYVERNVIPDIEDQLRRGDRPFESVKLSRFTDMVLADVKKVNTAISYKASVRIWFDVLEDKDVRSYRIADIDEAIKILSKKYSAASIITHIAPISRAFKEAMRLEIITRNPVSLAKKPTIKRVEKHSLNILQAKTLLDSAEGEVKKFLYYGLFTGARRSEILAFKNSDVDVDGRKIYITKTNVPKSIFSPDGTNSPKSGRKRTIPMIETLARFLETQEDKAVNMSESTIRLHIRALTESLGMENVTPHILRHTFTSLMLKAKEDVLLVKEFLGHSSLEMINDVYAHYVQDKDDCHKYETAMLLGTV